MEILTVPIEFLVPDADNPRRHPERNLDAIMASLAQHGQAVPLVVHAETSMVVAGNGTLEAMKRLEQGALVFQASPRDVEVKAL